MDRKEIKARAKAVFKANTGICIASFLALMAIVFVCTFGVQLLTGLITAAVRVTKIRGLIVTVTTITGLISGIIGFIVNLIFSLGLMSVYRKLMDGEAVSFSTLLSPITEGWFKLGFYAMFKMTMLCFLGVLLCYVPGVYLMLRWLFVPYICTENPDMTSKEILQLSAEMTKGIKLNLIVFYLSFIGWMMLGSITCGLAFLFTFPYMYLSMAGYYIAVREQYEGTE